MVVLLGDVVRADELTTGVWIDQPGAEGAVEAEAVYERHGSQEHDECVTGIGARGAHELEDLLGTAQLGERRALVARRVWAGLAHKQQLVPAFGDLGQRPDLVPDDLRARELRIPQRAALDLAVGVVA